MNSVRFGIIGLGNMGMYHANYFDSLENATLAAICDIDAKKLDNAAAKFPKASRFATHQELLASNAVDAVLVATPHYQHGEITLAAFDKNLHVLCEKPEAVTVTEARRMNEGAAKHPNLKFGIDFQMRTSPIMKKIREMVLGGDLGELSRLTWIATSWFRTNAYYASGGWRATWAGEGGGVLINQCPHNLDQLFWLTGMMPKRVTAVAQLGKTHPIEVEDEVSAILEYENGATGHFITTTGETPGTDRLEIAGDKGKLVAEGGKLTFRMLRQSMKHIRETDPSMFILPECWDTEIPLAKTQPDAKLITQNFVNAILKDEPLICPGIDGVKGLEIGNAMLMSGITRRPVELPIDGGAYEAMIKELAQKYGGRKIAGAHAGAAPQSSMASSFGGRA